MRYDQTYLWIVQREREREIIEQARAAQAREYARARRAPRAPRFHPLRRRVGGWLVRVGLWLIAPQACGAEAQTSS